MKKNGALQECFCLCHCASCEHCSCSPCSPAFHAWFFLLQFLVSSDFNPCNSFSFSFFCNFIYIEHLYKPQSVQTQINFTSLHVGNIETGEAVSPLLPPFPIFFHFLSSFSAAKHSSEDDNSEDVRLDLFLLEEEGCWLVWR